MKSFVALGQSNSILRTGFLNAIKERGLARFLRSAMIGASPSVIGPYFMDDVFFEGADYCLVDTCVVDFSVLTNNTADLYQIIQWIEWIGHKCRINNCQPIFVLLPVQTQVFNDHPLMSVYMAVINASRYLYLDVRDLIFSEIGNDTSRVGSLFTDPAHIGPMLIDRIAAAICSFLAFENDTVSVPRSVTCSNREFSVLKLTEQSTGFEHINYKNSLVSFSGIRISKNDRLDLHIGRYLKVHAIYLNAAKSRAKLLISGDVEVVKNFNLRPYSKVEFEARIVPIRTSVQDRNGHLRIGLAPANSVCDEGTMQEHSEFEGPEFIEIDGILVETGMHVAKYMTMIPSGPWDILALIR
jgi:hypothetical protein